KYAWVKPVITSSRPWVYAGTGVVAVVSVVLLVSSDFLLEEVHAAINSIPRHKKNKILCISVLLCCYFLLERFSIIVFNFWRVAGFQYCVAIWFTTSALSCSIRRCTCLRIFNFVVRHAWRSDCIHDFAFRAAAVWMRSAGITSSMSPLFSASTGENSFPSNKDR